MADEEKYSRREFLRKSGYAAGGLVGGGLIASLITKQVMEEDPKTKPSDPNLSNDHFNDAFMFFTNRDDFRVLAACCERIFPDDENGRGAIRLGVPFYIDHQLAGPWGNNTKEYMQGPFYKGKPTQGYQSRLNRGEIFRQGIQKIKIISQKEYQKSFQELEPKEQDNILSAFAQDKVNMSGTSSAEFFELMRAVTIEGVYADPMYGGNRNMEGWKMKDFPGAQMAYIRQIQSDQFVEMEPQSLHNMLNK